VFQTTLQGISVSDEKLWGEFTVHEGERIIFNLAVSSQFPAIIPEIKTTAIDRLDKTTRYWQNWIAKCKYNGPFGDWVRRSALALKLLTHAPSGPS
jgi:GH15 family glucan-1,4-alpha-glucosidase